MSGHTPGPPRSKLAEAVEAARGHADPVRDIPLLNEVAKLLKRAARAPTPYKVGRNLDGNLAIFTDQPASRELIAAFKSGTVTEETAAFIVRACNGWDDVAALRARLAELECSK